MHSFVASMLSGRPFVLEEGLHDLANNMTSFKTNRDATFTNLNQILTPRVGGSHINTDRNTEP